MAAVRASGLVKRFESTCAVDGVDLLVGQGEVRGLLGPNGAGKTTLLRLLFGLLRPDAGEIELIGRPLGATENASLEGVAGFVEEPAFYPYLSGPPCCAHRRCSCSTSRPAVWIRPGCAKSGPCCGASRRTARQCS